MISPDTIRTVISIVPDWEFETMTGYRWVKGEGGSHYWPGQWNLIPDWHKQIYLDALAAAAVREIDKRADESDWYFNSEFGGCAMVVGDDDDYHAGDCKAGPANNDRTANTLNAIAEFVRGGFDV